MLKSPSVVYQGEKGAFSYLCALSYFGEAAEYLGAKTFPEAFAWLQSGKAEFGVLPIENSLVGSIHEVYDLLGKFGYSIIAEEYKRIRHCLLCKSNNLSKEERMRTLSKVLSHPKALGQCQRFLSQYPWIEQVVHYDTAGSAKDLSQSEHEDTACIASKEAAGIYGLELLYENIEDDAENYTRFFVITKKSMQEIEANKATMMLTLEHKTGALVELLAILKENELNLSKIESRPLIGKAFEYVFYIDFEFRNLTKTKLKTVLEEIRPKTTSLQLLGAYKAGTL